MPFLDTNSHLTTKPYNFDIKCQGNSESYDQHNFFGTKFRGGQKILITVGGFYNEREYSGADWPVLLVRNLKDLKYICFPAVQLRKFAFFINQPRNLIPMK